MTGFANWYQRRVQALRVCASKTSYHTESLARQAAARHRLQPYKCPHCTAWHLTTP